MDKKKQGTMKMYRKKKLKFDNNLHLNANQNINSFESGRERGMMMNLQNLVNCRKSVKLKLRLLHRHFVLVGILQCNIYLGQMVEYQTNKKK